MYLILYPLSAVAIYRKVMEIRESIKERNIAVGGNWGGQKGVDDASLPWKLEIDYVRVYQR